MSCTQLIIFWLVWMTDEFQNHSFSLLWNYFQIHFCFRKYSRKLIFVSNYYDCNCVIFSRIENEEFANGPHYSLDTISMSNKNQRRRAFSFTKQNQFQATGKFEFKMHLRQTQSIFSYFEFVLTMKSNTKQTLLFLILSMKTLCGSTENNVRATQCYRNGQMKNRYSNVHFSIFISFPLLSCAFRRWMRSIIHLEELIFFWHVKWLSPMSSSATWKTWTKQLRTKLNLLIHFQFDLVVDWRW